MDNIKIEKKKLRQLYKKGLEQVFDLYQAPNTEISNFISSCLLVKDGTVLLNGIYGTGKTQLVQIIRKTFFSDGNGDSDYGYITCTQDLTAMDTLFDINLASLMQGKEEVSARALVGARFKFINEVQRANSLVYNALLPLLSEKMVIYRDQLFHSPNYLCFLDANPADSGSSEIPQAFMDRIDYSIDVPLMTSNGLINLQEKSKQKGMKHWGDTSSMIQAVLTSKQMDMLWKDVEQVSVSKEIDQILALLASYLQNCHYADRALVSQDYQLPCSNCTYRAETCSKLIEVPGSRFLLSLLRLAQARAWLQNKKEVEIEDILWGLPYTLSHRLKLKIDSLRLYPNINQWLKEELYAVNLRSKIPHWRLMLHHLNSNTLDNKMIESYASRDLAMENFSQQFMSQ